MPEIGKRDKPIYVFLKGSVTDAHLLSETHLSQTHFKTRENSHTEDHIIIFKLELRYPNCIILPLQCIFLIFYHLFYMSSR